MTTSDGIQSHERHNHKDQNGTEDHENAIPRPEDKKIKHYVAKKCKENPESNNIKQLSKNACEMIKFTHLKMSSGLWLLILSMIWTLFGKYMFVFTLSFFVPSAVCLFFPRRSRAWIVKTANVCSRYYFSAFFPVVVAFLCESPLLLAVSAAASGVPCGFFLYKLMLEGPSDELSAIFRKVIVFTMPNRFRLFSFPVSILCGVLLVSGPVEAGRAAAFLYLAVWHLYVLTVPFMFLHQPPKHIDTASGAGVSEAATLCLALVRAALAAAAWGLSAAPSLTGTLDLTVDASQAAAFVLALLCALTCALTDIVLSRRAL